MSDITQIVENSLAATSGAVTLSGILVEETPFKYSDVNYKITNYVYPTINPTLLYPLSDPIYDVPDDSFDMIRDDEAIKGSIHNIINTNKFERVMEPEFGLSINAMLFQLTDEDTVDTIHFELMKAFQRWDPRVYMKDISIVKDDPNNAIYINCEIGIEGIDRTIPVIFKNSIGTF